MAAGGCILYSLVLRGLGDIVPVEQPLADVLRFPGCQGLVSHPAGVQFPLE